MGSSLSKESNEEITIPSYLDSFEKQQKIYHENPRLLLENLVRELRENNQLTGGDFPAMVTPAETPQELSQELPQEAPLPPLVADEPLIDERTINDFLQANKEAILAPPQITADGLLKGGIYETYDDDEEEDSLDPDDRERILAMLEDQDQDGAYTDDDTEDYSEEEMDNVMNELDIAELEKFDMNQAPDTISEESLFDDIPFA